MNPATTTTPPIARPAGERVQRADARRNREAVLEAARVLMADQGLDAEVAEIARRAGLGVGTVYRHFPTKVDLVVALAEDRFERLAEYAHEALAEEDPSPAFETFIRKCAELQARDRALSGVMRETSGDAMRHAAERVDLLELTRKVLKRAQKAGSVRKEIRAEDIPMIMCGIGTATCTPAGGIAGPDGWERFVEIILAGMRA